MTHAYTTPEANLLAGVEQLAARQQASENDDIVTIQRDWPMMAPEAFHGTAGEFIKMLEPHTEADPAGILLQFLVMAGNLFGRKPHFIVEADKHFLNLFTVLVGETSKGRKGVSSGQAKRLFADLDQQWLDDCFQHGLASGEGLIYAVRDATEKQKAIVENGRETGQYETIVIDPGVADKRLSIVEPEFSSVLKQARREGNILSAVIRNAWDSGSLQTLTKNAPTRATGAHVSIIGHITKDELLRHLDSTEAANGFGNRFLWCCVRRSQFLPEGGRAHELDFRPIIEKLRNCLALAQKTEEIRRDDEATKIWAEVYRELSGGKPGLFGSMIGRAEAQTMRLACLQALLDHSQVVRAEHLLSALALWDYCEKSASWIFEDALGDPTADEILRALQSEPCGLTRSQVTSLFGRHLKRASISRALAMLQKQGLARLEKERTEGRPVERWYSTTECAESAKSAKRSEP